MSNVQVRFLRRGMSGEEVKAMQLRLRAEGLDLVADGKFGAKTEAAIRKFQESHKLLVDGLWGAQTNACASFEDPQKPGAMKDGFDTQDMGYSTAAEEQHRANGSDEKEAKALAKDAPRMKPPNGKTLWIGKSVKDVIGTSAATEVEEGQHGPNVKTVDYDSNFDGKPDFRVISHLKDDGSVASYEIVFYDERKGERIIANRALAGADGAISSLSEYRPGVGGRTVSAKDDGKTYDESWEDAKGQPVADGVVLWH